MDKKLLRAKLLKWHNSNNRNHYPWRNTDSPYQILVAEILLQRTKADQVLPIYFTFIKEFPDISSLAVADEKRIAQIIYPLGLSWRAKNFNTTANNIINNFNGLFPKKRNDLLRIKGVGEYVADSILYNAFKIRTSIIDSNIIRIIGRLFGLKTTPESRRNKIFRDYANDLLPKNNYRIFNYALLDLGALICVRKPKCDICPINSYCLFYNNHGG